MTPQERLARVVKAYDIRGQSPELLDESLGRALGAAYAEEVGVSRGRGSVVIGRDMRQTSPELAAAVVEGVTSTGADVVDVGLASTDLLYFASGALALPGVMVTASHNPAGDNGFKLCRAGARPIGKDTGLAAISEHAMRFLVDGLPVNAVPGRVTERDVLGAYAARLDDLVSVTTRREGSPLRVVVDAANAMAAHVVPAVLALSEVELVPLHFELDGRFPNHEANPLDPVNLLDVRDAVRRHDADLGLAFDGDADRCFVVDERGELVTPSALTALIADRLLGSHPGATILHSIVCSRAVPELVAERGGTPVRTRVGHSLIKAEMARTGAVFGGEHSGHYYFADFFGADSGLLAALHTMAALVAAGGTLSALASGYERYLQSGELNRAVVDVAATTRSVRRRFEGGDVTMDTLDGLSVEHDNWRFNLRPSQTESLLRLNVEADDSQTMTDVRDQVLAIIDQEATS